MLRLVCGSPRKREQVEQALSDTSFGIVTTTAGGSRPAPIRGIRRPEPGAEDFVDPAAHERAAARGRTPTRREFIGLTRSNARCRAEEPVAMELVRKAWAHGAQRTHHLRLWTARRARITIAWVMPRSIAALAEAGRTSEAHRAADHRPTHRRDRGENQRDHRQRWT